MRYGSFGGLLMAVTVSLSSTLFSSCAPASGKMEPELEETNLKKALLESFGEIPLDMAIAGELVSHVDAEVEKQGTANIIIDESWGITALHCACNHGSVKIVELLLSRGANSDLRDNNGELPISYAWNQIYSLEGRRAVSDEKITEEEAKRYAAIVEMLSKPEIIKPRTAEAEKTALQEVLIRVLAGCELKKDYYLTVNGKDVSIETLNVLREFGHRVFPGSEMPSDKKYYRDYREILCGDIKWVSDAEIEVELLEPKLKEWKVKLTSDYGYWMFELVGGGTIFVSE